VVVGIGAGMSAADGFTYIGNRFKKTFPDFIEKYNWFDMLQASLFEFPSRQEYWAFQSRFAELNYLDQPAGEGYIVLRKCSKEKNTTSLQLMPTTHFMRRVMIWIKFFIIRVNIFYGSVPTSAISRLTATTI